MNGHIVIINWSSDVLELVRTLKPGYEFLGRRQEERRDVVIIAAESVSLPDEEEFQNTYVHVGDPSERFMLARANVGSARTVIILADRRREHPDDHTLMLALAVNQYLRSEGLPTIMDAERHDTSTQNEINGGRDMVRVVAEVLDPANAPSFRVARVTGIHEVVCEEDLGLRILAQCSESPGMSRLLGEVLDRSEHSSEIHQIAVPDGVVGREFRSMSELFDLVYGPGELVRPKGDRTSLPLLIGFMRWEHGQPRVVVNPRNSWFERDRSVTTLRKGDALLVLCKGGRDASCFGFGDPGCRDVWAEGGMRVVAAEG